MKNKLRSPYDATSPSPSEEFIGIIHGIKNESPSNEVCLESIKVWMMKHLSEEELIKLEERDPSFDFGIKNEKEKIKEEEKSKEEIKIKEKAMIFFSKWATRIENGIFLKPLEGMKYKDNRTTK